jgi:hypothetical protein
MDLQSSVVKPVTSENACRPNNFRAHFTQVGYPFHCPRKAPPLLLGVSGRQHHNWWGTGTGSGRLGH